MKTSYYAVSDVGLKREKNEDYVLVSEKSGLYLLADGIGGHAAGEVASKLALNSADKFFMEFEEKGGDLIKNLPAVPDGFGSAEKKLAYAILHANKKVTTAAKEDPRLKGMGTTITALYLDSESVYFSHVGDSRIYLLSKGTLKQITRDHSVLNEKLKRGRLTPKEIENFPMKHSLTKAIGHMEKSKVDVENIKPEKGDIFLLCSDGLTDMVNHDGIEKILKENSQDVEKAGKELLKSAKAGGGIDNISIVLLRIDDQI